MTASSIPPVASHTIEELTQRIVARMTPEERATYEKGREIVDFYMKVATDDRLPSAMRDEARQILSACALREPAGGTPRLVTH